MIVCSCNVISDRQVRAVVTDADCRRGPCQIYRGLGCNPQCGRCARSIRNIMDEMVDGAATTVSALPYSSF